jgi:hypothetical protein
MCGTSVYYCITSHSMSMCKLAHENVDGALRCLHACAWHMCTCECLHGAMCTVRTAAQTHVCVCYCMCTIVCLKVFELSCMCRRGLTRTVRAMYVSAHAYTAANVYVCVYVCVHACSWKHKWILNLCVHVPGI